MGKYDALLAEAGTDEEENSKYGNLLAEVGESGDSSSQLLPKSEEMKPSEVLGLVAKGLGNYMLQGLPDVPYIAKKGWEAAKGLGGAVGQLFNKENYANTINHPLQAGKGAVKGLGSTALGIGASIAGDSPALRQINFDLTGKDDLKYNPPEILQPKTEAEQAGANLAGSALAIGGTLLSAKPIARAGFKAASSPSMAASLKGSGNRLQNRITKILNKEADSGANIENIGKHGLFGEPEVALEKGKKIVNDTYAQLKSVIEKENVPENYKSLNKVIDEAQERALSTATEGREAIVNAFDDIRKDYLGSDKVPGYFKSDIIDLADAQMLKQKTAASADWHHLSFNQKADGAKGTAYKSISNVLREHLEDAGGPEVKELNKKMSEVIPINTANAKRILVSSRKNPIELDDFVGYVTSAASIAHGNPLPAFVTIGNKIIKNPAFAEGVYKLGDKMDKQFPKSTPIKPEPQLQQPITDKRRLLSRQMIGEQDEPRMVGKYSADYEIPVGAKIRNLGEPGTPKVDYELLGQLHEFPTPSSGARYPDYFGDRKAIPSPEDFKKKYPATSRELNGEQLNNMVGKLDDTKAIPDYSEGKLIGDNPQQKEPMLPTMAERIRKIGKDNLQYSDPGTTMPKWDKHINKLIQDKGTVEEVIRLGKQMQENGIPVNMTKDQVEAIQDFMDYLTKMKDNDALKKTSYQPKKEFKKKK